MSCRADLICSSAPAVVKLFGEHAVAHGFRAIAAAVSLRAYAVVKRMDRDDIVLNLYDIKRTGIDLKRCYVTEQCSSDLARSIEYISVLLELIEEMFHVRPRGLEISVRSEIPVGSGLGSSAALISSISYSVLRTLGVGFTLDDIADLCYRTELRVQGIASPMDTRLTTFGGVQLVDPRRGLFRRLDVGGLDKLVLAYVSRESTTKELVNRVRRLRELMPDVVDTIFLCIDKIVERAIRHLEEGDLERVGKLMYVNHGLLNALGLSNERVERIVNTARGLGALGAKMSGAGLGGAVIVLAPGAEDRMADALRTIADDVKVVRVEWIGVREESHERALAIVESAGRR